MYCFGFFGEAFAAQLFQFVQVLRMFSSLSWSIWVELDPKCEQLRPTATFLECNQKVPPLCCLISSVLFKKMLPAPHLWLYITNHVLSLPCFNCLTVFERLLHDENPSLNSLNSISSLQTGCKHWHPLRHWLKKTSRIFFWHCSHHTSSQLLICQKLQVTNTLIPLLRWWFISGLWQIWWAGSKNFSAKTVSFWVWFSAVWDLPSSKHFWFPLKRSSLRCNKSATATQLCWIRFACSV